MIAARRAELAELVDALDVKVHDTVPEQITPPCVVLQAAEPFVVIDDEGGTFGDPYVVSFEILLLAPLDESSDNEQATRQLDGLLDTLLDTIRPTDWWVDSMGPQGPLMTLDWISHGQRVTVQRRTQL